MSWRPIQQLPGAMQAAGVVQSGIDRWMIIQILTVVNGCPLYFGDCVIDGVNCFLLHPQFAAIAGFEMGPIGGKVR